MNNKLLFILATAATMAAVATTTIAAPLPVGTRLAIQSSTDLSAGGGVVACTTGSCFGMFLAPGLYYWTPLHAGTDGGIIIGKGQKSGGQEINALSTNDGEIVKVWNYGANWGTFFTAPSDAGNIFDNASCTGAGCGSNTTPRLTDLAVWNTAWNGIVIPMGSAAGCNKAVLTNCTADQVAGIFVKTWTIDPPGTFPRKYQLTYNQVAPAGFPNFPFELILRGDFGGGDCWPMLTVSPAVLTGGYGIPLSFAITATGCDNSPLTCRVGTAPRNGMVTLAGCLSGTYTSDQGFIGTDSFTVIANDGRTDSPPFLVNVGLIPPGTSTPTMTATPTAIPTCLPPDPGTMYLTATTDQPVAWTGRFASFCGISQPPTNGTVTMTTNTTCSGVYTPNSGFIGRDKFVYAGIVYHCGIPTVYGTVYVDVCPPGVACGSASPSPTATITFTPTPTATIVGDAWCAMAYPVSQAKLIGKQGHLTLTVTGHIISVNPNGKEIKICPATTASYEVTSNTPGATVVCRIKSNTGRGRGNVKVNDHIKCTDKPVGNDKLNVKIKSGVQLKAM